MTPEERKEIAEVFSAVLEERRGVEADKHANHHRFLEMMIAREAKREERRERVRQQVAGWAVIMAVTGFFAAAAYAANHWFEELVKRVSH